MTGLWKGFFFGPAGVTTDLIAHYDGERVAVVARGLSAPVAMAHSLYRVLGLVVWQWPQGRYSGSRNLRTAKRGSPWNSYV